MDTQTLFNIATGIAGALGMWVLNGIKDSLNALHRSDMDLSAKLQTVELLVAGAYVKKDEMDKLGSAIFVKLDKIENKLDGKADRANCDQVHFKAGASRDAAR